MTRYWLYEKISEAGTYGFIHYGCEEQIPMSPVGWGCRGLMYVEDTETEPLCLICDLALPLQCPRCEGAADEPDEIRLEIDCFGYEDCLVDKQETLC